MSSLSKFGRAVLNNGLWVSSSRIYLGEVKNVADDITARRLCEITLAHRTSSSNRQRPPSGSKLPELGVETPDDETSDQQQTMLSRLGPRLPHSPISAILRGELCIQVKLLLGRFKLGLSCALSDTKRGGGVPQAASGHQPLAPTSRPNECHWQRLPVRTS